jgi:hypothetical protein
MLLKSNAMRIIRFFSEYLGPIKTEIEPTT